MQTKITHVSDRFGKSYTPMYCKKITVFRIGGDSFETAHHYNAVLELKDGRRLTLLDISDFTETPIGEE